MKIRGIILFFFSAALRSKRKSCKYRSEIIKALYDTKCKHDCKLQGNEISKKGSMRKMIDSFDTIQSRMENHCLIIFTSENMLSILKIDTNDSDLSFKCKRFFSVKFQFRCT